MSKSQFRRCVLRDIGWLMNASNAEGKRISPRFPRPDYRWSISACPRFPERGCPIWTGQRAPNRTCAERSSPLSPGFCLTLWKCMHAREGLEHHNQVFFEIRGQLWCEPYPLELLRSQLDLESGQVLVQDMAGKLIGSAPARILQP